MGERTFRWRGVGSDTRDYFHVPLPRRERVAALLTLGSGTVQCNRAGIRRPHGSILSPPCKRRNGADFGLHRFHFRYTARATSVAGWPWPPLLCPRKLAALIERSAASLFDKRITRRIFTKQNLRGPSTVHSRETDKPAARNGGRRKASEQVKVHHTAPYAGLCCFRPRKSPCTWNRHTRITCTKRLHI